MNNDSILDTIKDLSDINNSDSAFDTEMISYINSAFFNLYQLGIGPDKGFHITDNTQTWHDYVNDESLIGEIQLYIKLKIRLVFDPPVNSFVVTSIENQIKEIEWRLNAHVDTQTKRG